MLAPKRDLFHRSGPMPMYAGLSKVMCQLSLLVGQSCLEQMDVLPAFHSPWLLDEQPALPVCLPEPPPTMHLLVPWSYERRLDSLHDTQHLVELLLAR
jgi:hypothetical protein